MDREALYARLPIALQQWAVSAEGRRIRRRRFDAAFHRLLQEYNARGAWSAEARMAYRDERLARFIEHAVQTVPYYRECFRDLGAHPGDFRRLSDLAALPVLTKQTVQARTADFVSEAVCAQDTTTIHTSGTTGAGLRFPATHDSQREHWAVWWRFRGWHGIPFDTPCLYFGGRSVVPARQRKPPFWRYNRPGRQILFSGYHLSEANAAAYIAEIQRSGYRWIHGYPSLVALLAHHVLRAGVQPGIRWVSLGAESVLPHQRAVIEQAFGVQAITHYSMAEGVANVSMAPDGNYYVDEDFAAVEFLPREDGNHDIVGTNFSNPAFPLIRYQVGDHATLPAEASSGGFGRQVIAIDGRKEDYIITKHGARIGRLDHIFKDMTRVREAQIRQSRAGAMTLVVVKGADFGEADARQLREETRKRVGDDVDFTIEYADAIPRSASGKLRFVVSTLDAGRIDTPGL